MYACFLAVGPNIKQNYNIDLVRKYEKTFNYIDFSFRFTWSISHLQSLTFWVLTSMAPMVWNYEAIEYSSFILNLMFGEKGKVISEIFENY